MRNEKLNKANWQSRLEDADALAEETLQHKSDAWKRLQGRLYEKPRRQRAAWYWIAAACMVPAVLLPLFFLHKNGSSVVKLIPAKQVETKPVLSNEEVQKASVVVIKNGSKPRSNFTVKQKRRPASPALTESKAAVMQVPVITTEMPVQPFASADSTAAVTIAPVARRKLKVVHINELGDPAEAPVEIAHTPADLHSFQLKLANEEVFTKPMVAYRSAGITIVKSKPSTSN